LPFSEVIFLGVLQGVTEFLPVSSSGHLALAQTLFGVSEPSLTLGVMLHGGTLGATVVLLRQRLAAMTLASLRAFTRPRTLGNTEAGWDTLWVLVASIPTGVIGLSTRDLVARWTATPLVVAIGFFLTGLLLVSSRFTPQGNVQRPSLWLALLLGVVQGMAVLPGLSRSGSTITVALWLGVRPDRAFQLSMLMSLPAVLGAVALEARHAFGGGEGATMVLGAAVAFGVGLSALWLLQHSLRRGYFAWFALWVFPLALATLALAWSWPVRM
jgi:undecaprenyl-diphosphatase